MLPAWALKGLATAATVASVFGAAAHVGGALRNPQAPLHPKVVPLQQLNVSAGVESTNLPAVTATYES